MLGFTQPVFLFGLGLLAAPLLLHLIRREVAVRVVFPSIRFVLRGRLPSSGRRRLRDRLMLLARLAALTLLVLAFAGPRWTSHSAPALPGDDATPGLDVLLVDVSASMGGWGSLERAVTEAGGVLDAFPDRRVALIASARVAETLVAPTRDHDAVHAALERLTATKTSARHGVALRQAADLLADESTARIWIFSDFQAGGWSIDDLPALPDNVELELVEVGSDRSRNAAVLGARTRRLSDGSLRVVADIHNFAAAPVSREVTFSAGTLQRRQSVELMPQQTLKTVFVLPPTDTVVGEVALDADAYTDDDSYLFWLGATPPRILRAVVPFNQEPELAQEQFFLRQALTVQDDSPLPAFDLQFYDTDSFFAIHLAQTDAVLLLGAAGYLQDDDLTALAEFIEAGGTVLSTPSRRVSGAMFLRLQRHGLLTVEYQGLFDARLSGANPAAVGWMDPAGILASVFTDPRQTDLFMFPIRRHIRFKPVGLARDVLRSEAGDSLLLAQPVGAGSFFAMAFGFGTDWSDFPLSGAFVPLVRELLTHAATDDRRSGIVRLECGDPLPDRYGTVPAAARDDGVRETLEPAVLEHDGRPVEINVPRSESMVATASRVAIRERLLPGRETAAAAAVPSAENGQSLSLWLAFALAAAALFAGEGALAAGYDRRDSHA